MESVTEKQTIPYPKSVFFIISNEFCERFSYYGLRTILSLYLRDVLNFNESDSKIIYHGSTVLVYFFPILGAILADSWLGQFKTIFYVSIIYACGNISIALAAAKPIGLPQIPFTMLGLILIAIGAGGIKPCVSTFGGDQFTLPQQALQLATFFSMFYFAINAGSLITTILSPVLREDVHCFGENHCYPLAFAVPGVLMIISIVVFALGKPFYKIRKPEGNLVLRVSKCIGYAIKQKFKAQDKVAHWLDRSEAKFGKPLVYDVQTTIKVLILYIPLPIFWTLFDQQGSGWTFQATRMNGDIGFYTILPDQMQVINPLLILIFIPLFTYGIYPVLARMNILKKPLQRMVFGGLLAAAAFGISAGVSFALEATYPELPGDGNAQIRIYNPLNCNATLNVGSYIRNVPINSMSYTRIKVDNISGEKMESFNITGCDNINYQSGDNFTIIEKKALIYYFTNIRLKMLHDDIEKDKDGLPKIKTLINKSNLNLSIIYYSKDKEVKRFSSNLDNTTTLSPGTYTLLNSAKKLHFHLGGVYTVLASVNDYGKVEKVEYFEVTQPNSIHILWLIPQYVVITAAEIMFSITGLEFSYSQAPVSMKSVMQAAWLITTAIGNLVVVVIESAKIFEKQSYDFLLYAGLMILDVILFAFMAMKYVPLKKDEERIEKPNRFAAKEKYAIVNPSFKYSDDDRCFS